MNPRKSGILCHPTSLWGRFGSGDLGREAHDFVDLLVEAGQTLWQWLPYGAPIFGLCPYTCRSAFAGNPLLISPEKLQTDGLLSKSDLARPPDFSATSIDAGPVYHYRMSLLDQAFVSWNKSGADHLRHDYKRFLDKSRYWLPNYALFSALKDEHDGQPWHHWSADLAKREKKSLSQARARLADTIEKHKFFQFCFYRQCTELRDHCRERGIQIIGDMPLFVAYDSADVWANQELFKLDREGKPKVVSGVPPDYFSATGQLWGNPLYNWQAMKAADFRWWVERLKCALALTDFVRVDHFRGFAACWEVPAHETTAINGKWVRVPGRQLFAKFRQEFGDDLPIMAEDLGIITPDVEKLRDDFDLPGMKVLQFAFGEDSHNPHLPHNFVTNSAAYSGTHDNDTTLGWYTAAEDAGYTQDGEEVEKQRLFAQTYLQTDGNEIHWDFIRACMASVAKMAIFPLQDVLGLPSDARMNVPGTRDGNWQWRFQQDDVLGAWGAELRRLTELYGRLPDNNSST
jgi:4-alpha-glucanotransferase